MTKAQKDERGAWHMISYIRAEYDMFSMSFWAIA